MQPADANGRPICPVCFQPIPLGEGVIRGTDELSVHQECHDRVMSWRPPPWPVDNALDSEGRRVCPLCGLPIAQDEAGQRRYGYMLHRECWPTAGVSAVRIHVGVADWEQPDWRSSFETGLGKMGWGIVAVDRSAPAGAEVVYVVVVGGDAAIQPAR
jgi:hypothetical protein